MKKLTLSVVLMCASAFAFAQTEPIVFFDGETYGFVSEDDGEGGTIFRLQGRFQPQSSETLAVVANPLRGGVNTSAYVMEVAPNVAEGATKPANRCILMLRISDSQVPEGENKIDVTGYTHFSFKYYAPEITGSLIRVQWDASETNPLPSELSPVGGAWETVDFAIPSSKKWGKFQIMLNQNQSWVDGGNNTMYIDDIRVYVAGDNAVGSKLTSKTEKSAQYFDLTGKPVTAGSKGFVIKRTLYEDGSVENSKVVVK
jgi:hypothetical protein